MEAIFADIIVDISHESVDRTFQYRIPESLADRIAPGVAVMIPFGKGNKLIRGYIMELSDHPNWEVSKIKDIDSVLTGELGPEAEAIRLACWMKHRYGSTMIAALKTVLPVKQKITALVKKTIVRNGTGQEMAEYAIRCGQKSQKAKQRLLEELVDNESIPYELVTGKIHISPSTLRALVSAGYIIIEEEQRYRDTVHQKKTADIRPELSDEQQQVVDAVTGGLLAGHSENFLIHGITGSGKTEVYMEIVSAAVRQGKQAIILIPEIALTYQTVIRFYRRFGERVSVVNSRLSAGEKYDQFEKAKQGLIDVIIGPRSALFTPFSKLGVIIIDEEHETSYKSENMPRYHARDVAMQIASYHDACVVLGSATPSVEAYTMAKEGKLRLFHLTKRLTGGMLPKVSVVDLRDELKNGNRSIFSIQLQELLQDRLDHGEQSMLFLNRRGIAGFVSCRACGHVMKCPHCDVSLSEHRNGKLVCHYCGYEQMQVKLCPECGSKYISGFKAGTQKIEDAVHQMYPKARVLRMDADTTKSKDSYDEILSSFSAGEADILIGTQMIVKGHDFPNVTLMGVLAADLSLNASDYRAGERTFDLLTQAAGRAGRGKRPGEVVIQTYQPEHYSIRYAADQDYEGFYQEEMAYRDFMLYPPAAHMLAVQLQSKEAEAAVRLAEHLKQRTGPLITERRILVIGPAAPSVEKVKDIYRQMLYYKHKNIDDLVAVKDLIESEMKDYPVRDECVLFDMDPMNT